MKIIITVAIALLVLMTACSTGELSVTYGSRKTDEGVFSVWQRTEGDNRCTTTSSFIDCFSERYSYTYSGITAVANADILATHGLQKRDPDCYDVDGTPLFLAPLKIDYKCYGDKMYVKQGTTNFPSCTVSGCNSGLQSSNTGTITFYDGTDPIPPVVLQCWDYQRTTVGSQWAESWTWVGISYGSYSGRVVTSCPVLPTCSDGIKNADETGIDCGGSKCQACTVPPTCNDGIMNGVETGVDCGGTCSACATNEEPPTPTGERHWWQFLVDFWNWIKGLFAA